MLQNAELNGRAGHVTESGAVAVTVWLWDAPARGHSVRGVTLEFSAAQRAAKLCLEAGQATVAVVQEAELVFADAGLESCYRRIGGCWRASRARNGTVRWRHLPTLAAS